MGGLSRPAPSAPLPKALLSVWRQFDALPMETLTKAWLASLHGAAWQRSVAEMRQHHAHYGTAGNCFDLARWLMADLVARGIEAWGIGHDVWAKEAHVAVVAHLGGARYLCDLGDMWLLPAPLDRPWAQPESGWFPAARVQLEHDDRWCRVTYHRPGGKVSHQAYDLTPLDDGVLCQAGELSQQRLSAPLVEVRLWDRAQPAHWEFSDWRSWLSTDEGLEPDPPLGNDGAWAGRIAGRTGIHPTIAAAALRRYREGSGGSPRPQVP